MVHKCTFSNLPVTQVSREDCLSSWSRSWRFACELRGKEDNTEYHHSINITVIYMWWSRVEIEHYSVVHLLPHLNKLLL